MNEESYSKRDIFQTLFVIIAICALMNATGGSGYAVVLPMTLYALMKKKAESLSFWVLMTICLIQVNGFFAPKDFICGITFRATLAIVGICGAFLFMSTRASRLVMPFLGVFLYLLYMIIPSSVGWSPKISFLKLFLYSTVYMALIYMATIGINKQDFNMPKLRSVILAISIFIIFGSVLLIPFPSISLMNVDELIRTGSVATSLYKGATSHSQTLGIFACCLTVFLLADWVFCIQKMNKLYAGLVVCGFFLVYKTSSRTAMGSLLISSLFIVYCMMKVRGVRSNWKGKVVHVTVALFMLLIVLIISVPSFKQATVAFAVKYGKDKDVRFQMEDVTSTRMGLIEKQMANFHRRPAIGWGFQVSEEIASKLTDDAGIVISAPVEKGVWVTAILEEGGVIGATIYYLYALFILPILMSRKAYMAAVMFVLIHISNLGEMTMFSMSGCGGVWYLFMFVALIFDVKRIERLNLSYAMRYQ